MPSARDMELVAPKELEEAWRQNPDIVKYGAPVLRQVAEPVARINAEIRTLIDRMAKIMEEADGLGLAAPQVGVSKRLFVYHTKEGVRALVNPQIVSEKGEQFEPVEGCLSIPGLMGQVKRAKEVRVRAFDRNGRPITLKATDLEARVIQHELDHLNGVLFIDKADPETIRWHTGEEDDEDDGALRE